MTTEQITSLVISLAPSVITILTMVGLILKVVFQFRDLKKQVTDMKSVKEVNDKIATLVQENAELKHQMNELLTKIDRVERK